jgi:hypothetical protein
MYAHLGEILITFFNYFLVTLNPIFSTILLETQRIFMMIYQKDVLFMAAATGLMS